MKGVKLNIVQFIKNYFKSMNNPSNKVVFYPCQEVEGRSAAAVTKPSGEKTTFTENNRGADQTKTTYIHDKGMMDE